MRWMILLLGLTAGCDACSKSSQAPATPTDAAPAALAFCKQHASGPCEDFDDPSFEVGTRVVHADDGDAKLVPGEQSKPQALSFAVAPAPAADGGARVFYFLDASPPPKVSGAWMMMTNSLTHPVNEARLLFGLKIGALTGSVTLARVSLGSYVATLEADPRGARLVESYMEPDAKPRVTALDKPLPRGAWGSVSLALVVDKSLVVTVNDAKTAEATPLPVKARPSQAEGIVGVRQDGDPSANDAAFDDVFLDAK
jgi:hypothetical protein